MKNIYLLPLLLLFFQNGNAQENSWKIGLVLSGHYDKGSYSLTDAFAEEKQSIRTLPMGHSIAVEVEKSWSPNWSFQTGVAYSKVNFFPNMYLPWAYGTLFEPVNISDRFFIPTVINTPVLQEHRMGLLSIPLVAKFNFRPNKIIQPFVSFGISTSFKINELEVYSEERFLSESSNSLFIEDPGVDLFGFGFDSGFGLQWQFNEDWTLMLRQNIRLGEYRKGNEKFKRNGEFLYTDHWLSNSQLKLNLGVFKTF